MAETTLSSRNGTYQHRTVKSASSIGLNLGELRALLETCAGIPDTALVFVSGVSKRDDDASKSWVREIHVQHSEATQ